MSEPPKFTPIADFGRSQATLFVNGDGTETVTVLHEATWFHEDEFEVVEEE